MSAFAPPAPISSFTARSVALSSRSVRVKCVSIRQSPRMEGSFMEPQPGDPGYNKSPPPRKTDAVPNVAAPKVAKDLPVNTGTMATMKRGIDLLKDDFLKKAPEAVGVGRQDVQGLTMKPAAGEPGYKPESYQTVYVSELGISPFPDDANAVGKVGGLQAVKTAAVDVKRGKTAKQIKKSLLKDEKIVDEPPVVFDIPDYLKPLPEDTPGKRLSWKNYNGR